ncbi:MAG TPA: hypothetical protein VN894_05685 [Polyangiaceae bacterium]|nr:hypothetical protein [Polyangiaceae bacterium]
MPSMSKRPLAPESFGGGEYERDSEVHVKAARRTSESAAPEMPHSETRIATHPKTGAVTTDEAWAQQTIGEPIIAMSPDELRCLPLDHRAGFLLSLMDGTTDLETVIDLSVMPRANALRIVRDLFECGVITFR